MGSSNLQNLTDSITKICSKYKNNEDTTNMSNLGKNAVVSRDENFYEDEEWHNNPVTPGSHELLISNAVSNILLQAFISQQNLQNATLLAFCGSLRYRKTPVQCGPTPDAFNPCEDIMGYEWLRICIWFVVSIGLFGNLCVLAVILCKPTEITVQNFLISNLAFTDLCMAIFLLLLATEDLVSRGYYFNYAYDWQRGLGCQIAGFITIFSSQLSIFTLCLLTIERWFTIKKALYLHKLNFQNTIYITIYGWLYALIMATLPLIGVSDYSTTSLCLPMGTKSAVDKAYVVVLLLVASTVFVAICTCYIQIYFSLSYETRRKDSEYVLARKMAILVGTNFLCWAPITFFALTAVLGFPLIDITNSKILLVFFYPLNSCANPFLYAILTANFRKNFVCMLSKFGICQKSAENYKLVYCQPRGSNRHPIQRPSTSHTLL